MIAPIARLAWRLDEWLHHRLGKPYRATLTVGLMADIVHRAVELPRYVETPHHLVGHMMGMALGVGLLIHQVAEMHTRIGYGRERPGRLHPDA
ncbi:MAG: hypothetical protein EON89_12455 [Brevundimonas sp.]|nr:MAG: hypothetical protein EON89_12455 [Brevundimonas sp.]